MRADRIVYIYPFKEEEVVTYDEMGQPEVKATPMITKEVVSKIGDLTKNTATCKISMEKDTFELGEPLIIHYDMDNSKVGKKVKSFKMKLNRVYVTRNPGNPAVLMKKEV